MGEDIFNFVLSDISGIPSLPVFIGNYLLDLLSAFFPIFIILSSFVMVYIGFTRGSGDWKQTGQQIAPTAVSIAVIMGLLSMKTPYSESNGTGLSGEFWKDVNSYTVVEMMNTFLGFGNIFADALTHKIIYGSIDVSDANGDNGFNGYFPSVLQALVEREQNKNEDLKTFLNEKAKNKDFHDKVVSDYNIVTSNTQKLIKNLYYLGVIDDHTKIRNGYENEISSYNHLKNKKYIIDDFTGKNESNGALLTYTLPAIFVGAEGGGVINANTDEGISDKYLNKKTLFLNHDTLLGENPREEALLIDKLNTFKSNGNSSLSSEAKEEDIYSYLAKGNFSQEKIIIENLQNLIEVYGKLYNIYDSEIKEILAKSKNTKNNEHKNVLNEKANEMHNFRAALISRINSVAELEKDIVNLYSGFTNSNSAEVSSRTAAVLESLKNDDKTILSYQDVKTGKAISKEESDAIIKEYNNSLEAKISPAIAHSDNMKRHQMINNNLNNMMKSRAYITNIMFDKYKDILKDDSLFQLSLGFGAINPFNVNFLNENKVRALTVLQDKKSEIVNKYLDEQGNINVSDKLKKAIDTELAGTDLAQGKIIHWTDLGKHYATFKNLFSPMITNIYAMEKMNSADVESVASLLQLMEEMEPSKKTERLLGVAYTFATGKVVLGASKAAKSIASASDVKGSGADGGFKDFWEAIKIIGGVYFAIFFVNVVLPAFVWMFAIVTYYIEMSMYVAVFPIGFMFMIFQSYRQSLHQYINMLLGFILMPIILVSMYFVVLYIDMLLPMFFKQFMPFFASNHEFGNAFKTAFGGQGDLLQTVMNNVMEGAGNMISKNDIDQAKNVMEAGGGTTAFTTPDLMNMVGNFIYTILSLLMSALLLMTFFRANEYMSKILNVSTVGMDSFQGRETINKFGSFDKSGMTAGIIGR